MKDLKERRLAAGLTQEELAYRAGVSWSTIQYLESGDRKAMRSTIAVIEAALERAENGTDKDKR